MSAAKLAFLQNFYTDVTLYVPAEPVPVPDSPTSAIVSPSEAPNRPVGPPEAAAGASNRPAGGNNPPAAPFAQAAGDSNPSAGPFNRSAGDGNHSAGSFNRSAGGLLPPSAPAGLPPVAPAGLPKPAVAPLPPATAPSVPVSGAPAPQPLAPTLLPAPAVPPVMLTTFATQGSNAHGVVLLVRLPEAQFLKLHRNVFLNKMLQALGQAMGDVVLVNVESHLPVALVNLRRELAATRILAFGKNLLDTTIRNTQIYEPVQFPSIDLAYLASAEIELVEYDNGLKKRLWAGLQRMFPQ